MAFLDDNYLLSTAAGRELFRGIASLPVVDPHNHANVKEIADNSPYTSAWQLFAATDHYVWEMLRKCGVPEELITGGASPREKFLAMAKVFPLIAGNPVYEWIHLDLKRYFGIDEVLSEATGERICDAVDAKLATPAFRPQELLQGPLNVETMSSTDDLIDTLDDHKRANRQLSRTVIRPTWRPDKAMKIGAPGWREYIAQVEKRFSMRIASLADLFEAMRRSHEHFAECGCRASDHGFEVLPDVSADPAAADRVFRRALAGERISGSDAACYAGAFFGEAAKLNAETGWVTQLHMGAVRDVRNVLFETLGPDSGGDVSYHMQEMLPALTALLNAFESRLKVVLYSLDPGHWPTLATVSRAFGATVTCGAAWWLNDTPCGMRRQMEYLASIDLLSNYAGMVSDSRKLLSYGSRFEMFRRILADVVGTMVERGQIPDDVAQALVKRIAYEGPKRFWNL